MSDVRDPLDPPDMTDDEYEALHGLGFDIGEGFHDYGNSDLLMALRRGYALGLRDEETS